MRQQRGMFALFLSIVLMSSIGLFAQNKDDKKRDDAQKKEIQNIVKLVDDAAAAGQAATNDLSLTWLREDVLKAQGNKEYVPFTVSLDPSKLTGDKVAFYWRVVAKDGAAAAEPPPAAGKKDDKKKDDKDKGKKSDYAYEDISFVPVTPGQNPMRISRSFTVPAGAYDIFIV